MLLGAAQGWDQKDGLLLDEVLVLDIISSAWEARRKLLQIFPRIWERHNVRLSTSNKMRGISPEAQVFSWCDNHWTSSLHLSLGSAFTPGTHSHQPGMIHAIKMWFFSPFVWVLIRKLTQVNELRKCKILTPHKRLGRLLGQQQPLTGYMPLIYHFLMCVGVINDNIC